MGPVVIHAGMYVVGHGVGAEVRVAAHPRQAPVQVALLAGEGRGLVVHLVGMLLRGWAAEVLGAGVV